MKKARNLAAFLLIVIMTLSMTTNVFAGWATYNGSTYNSGNVYLEEKWIGDRQIIHYYANGSLTRTVSSRGNQLWIDSWPVLNNLYDTCYWCYDKWGNIYVIDAAQNLLLCRSNSTTFVVNTSILGCTGFQRDGGKFGYLVYTNNGSYSLEELLRGNNFNNNFNNTNVNNSVNNSYVQTYYPYVEQSGTMLYYYESSNKYYIYTFDGSTLYYRGSNGINNYTTLATSVKDVVFQSEWNTAYIVYADSKNDVYRYPLGKTSKSYKQQVGERFSDFVEYDYISDGYYNKNGVYKNFDVIDKKDVYPRVENDGKYYYYYTSSSKYYKYYMSGGTLYYKGTQNVSSNAILARDVEEIIFSDEGYIVYANTSDKVYAFEIGKTSTSYKEYIGNEFDDFEDNDDDYMSDGYVDDYDDWIDFDL